MLAANEPMPANYSQQKIVWRVWFKKAADFLLKRFKIVNGEIQWYFNKKVVQSVLKLRSKGKQISLFRPQMMFPLVVLLRMGINPF